MVHPGSGCLGRLGGDHCFVIPRAGHITRTVERHPVKPGKDLVLQINSLDRKIWIGEHVANHNPVTIEITDLYRRGVVVPRDDRASGGRAQRRDAIRV